MHLARRLARYPILAFERMRVCHCYLERSKLNQAAYDRDMQVQVFELRSGTRIPVIAHHAS